MADSGLPTEWEVRHSNSKNLPYYFNATTKESRWEPPSGTDTEKLKTFMAQHHSTANARQDTGGAEGKIRASHLLVKHKDSRRPSSWREAQITRSKEEALEILRGHEERIQSGSTTLGDLAVSESDCSSARKRGDLGFFGRGEMQKEFEEAAFALKPGEVSSVVETASGVHLIERCQVLIRQVQPLCLSEGLAMMFSPPPSSFSNRAAASSHSHPLIPANLDYFDLSQIAMGPSQDTQMIGLCSQRTAEAQWVSPASQIKAAAVGSAIGHASVGLPGHTTTPSTPPGNSFNNRGLNLRFNNSVVSHGSPQSPHKAASFTSPANRYNDMGFISSSMIAQGSPSALQAPRSPSGNGFSNQAPFGGCSQVPQASPTLLNATPTIPMTPSTYTSQGQVTVAQSPNTSTGTTAIPPMDQIDKILAAAAIDTDLDPLPPSAMSILIASEFLAKTVRDNWKTLEAEQKICYSMYRQCCLPGGMFDGALWNSFVGRLNQTYTTLKNGTLPALFMLIKQVQFWVEFGRQTPGAGASFFAEAYRMEYRANELHRFCAVIVHFLKGFRLPDFHRIKQEIFMAQKLKTETTLMANTAPDPVMSSPFQEVEPQYIANSPQHPVPSSPPPKVEPPPINDSLLDPALFAPHGELEDQWTASSVQDPELSSSPQAVEPATTATDVQSSTLVSPPLAVRPQFPINGVQDYKLSSRPQGAESPSMRFQTTPVAEALGSPLAGEIVEQERPGLEIALDPMQEVIHDSIDHPAIEPMRVQKAAWDDFINWDPESEEEI